MALEPLVVWVRCPSGVALPADLIRIGMTLLSEYRDRYVGSDHTAHFME